MNTKPIIFTKEKNLNDKQGWTSAPAYNKGENCLTTIPGLIRQFMILIILS